MKIKIKSKRLRAQDNIPVEELSRLIGQFIEYWGFKPVQGRIWTYLQLAERPLSTRELTELVGLSKGALSQALTELQSFGVVELTERGRNGMSYYRAAENINASIVRVLVQREAVLLSKIQGAFTSARRDHAFARSVPFAISPTRANDLGNWIEMAGASLQQLIAILSIGAFTSAFMNPRAVENEKP